MPPAAVATPNPLVGPGWLFIAPLASTEPTNTVVGGVFTDSWAAAWLPLGSTEDGTEFTYGSTIESVTPAEFFDPVAYYTTARAGSITFNLTNFALSNYRRALNGGTAALTPTSGTGATALYQVEPPTPGNEVRVMIGWESLDSTVRMVARQCLQGGEITTSFKKAPTWGVIPCTYSLEKPASAQPFTLWSAGAARG